MAVLSPPLCLGCFVLRLLPQNLLSRISHFPPAPLVSMPQVFATFCSKLMGPLFQVLSGEPAVSTPAASPSPLRVAAKTLVCEALFHEENLEGYREAFTAAERATAEAAAAATPGGAGGVEGGNNPVSSEGGSKKKRRRKNKGADGGRVADGGSGGDGSGGKAPRRVCYQQQLLDEMAVLAAGSPVERARWSRLGAMAGAPLLLEGFITRLGKAQHHEAGDIHGGAGAAAAVSTAGVKRSRSSGTGGGAGGGAGFALSPASQMFRLWALLTSTLSASLEYTASPAEPAFPPLLLPYLRSGNSMLRLLADHDVYRINEDWGGLEFDQLRNFSAGLIRLASAEIARTNGGSGYVDITAMAMVVSGDNRGKSDCAPDEAAAGDASSSLGKEDGEGRSTGAAQEFLGAFGALLGLNHNILHDDLRPVLRMTFDWAATAETGTAATGDRADDNNAAGDGGVPGLRALAIGLVVSLVDTYGRLRQMDHLVRALFGAVADRPSAAAAVLRRDECTAALGR